MQQPEISQEEIKEIVLSVNPRARGEKVAHDTHLFKHGLLDSFSVVQVVLAFEERLQIAFDHRDVTVPNFRSVNDMAEMLRSKYGCKIAP